MVTAPNAVVYKAVGATPVLTVTTVLTDIPAESNTLICAEPAATPLKVRVVPLTVTVATLLLLLRTE